MVPCPPFLANAPWRPQLPPRAGPEHRTARPELAGSLVLSRFLGIEVLGFRLIPSLLAGLTALPVSTPPEDATYSCLTEEAVEECSNVSSTLHQYGVCFPNSVAPL